MLKIKAKVVPNIKVYIHRYQSCHGKLKHITKVCPIVVKANSTIADVLHSVDIDFRNATVALNGTVISRCETYLKFIDLSYVEPNDKFLLVINEDISHDNCKCCKYCKGCDKHGLLR